MLRAISNWLSLLRGACGSSRNKIAFKLIAHILDKVFIDTKLLDQVMIIMKEQLQSMSAFLKAHSIVWFCGQIRRMTGMNKEQYLKLESIQKLSVFQAAARLKLKVLHPLIVAGESSKKLLLSTLALLVDNAEACLFSVWRKLRTCEELFQFFAFWNYPNCYHSWGQLLADTWGNSQEPCLSVLKTSCEIIEFGWSRTRSPVDSFIMGLAHSIPDLNVSVKKPEVVDMILPLFIETLEEDASTPVWDLKNLTRETIVLMTRSYLSKLSVLAQLKTLPAGFLLIASALSSSKLRSDYKSVGGPYMWNTQWSSAVQRISQGTPPLGVAMMASANPRTALSAALGGGLSVAAMSGISGL
ncbi:Phosphatidylinositol 4-kinase alpha 1, partial [Camellia lanceoleosa]